MDPLAVSCCIDVSSKWRARRQLLPSGISIGARGDSIPPRESAASGHCMPPPLHGKNHRALVMMRTPGRPETAEHPHVYFGSHPRTPISPAIQQRGLRPTDLLAAFICSIGAHNSIRDEVLPHDCDPPCDQLATLWGPHRGVVRCPPPPPVTIPVHGRAGTTRPRH